MRCVILQDNTRASEGIRDDIHVERMSEYGGQRIKEAICSPYPFKQSEERDVTSLNQLDNTWANPLDKPLCGSCAAHVQVNEC